MIRGVLAAAAIGVLGLRSPAPADVPAPAAGDILIATQSAVPASGIVLVNALGGQTQIATFDGIEHSGAYASSIVHPGDGFIYATLDDVSGDTGDALVRIDPTTGDVTTLVNQTTAQDGLDSPRGLDMDPVTGDLIFVQANQVMRADPATGAVSIVSQASLLGNLRELVVDPTGTYAYVVDDAEDAVVRVTLADGAQKRVVVNQSAPSATVLLPGDLVLDGTEVVAVAQLGSLARFGLSNGKGETIVERAVPGGTVWRAQGIDIDPAGNFVVVDANANEVVRVSPSGSQTVVSSGGLIRLPQDVVVVGGASQSTGGPIGGGGGGNACALCGLSGDVDGRAKTKVKKVGASKRDMDVSVVFDATAATWTATMDGLQIAGTSTTNKKRTKAVLTPDAASLNTLLAIVGNRLDAPDPQPMLLYSRAPKLIFKTNKKATKGTLIISVKVETDIGPKTYKGALRAKLKGGAIGR